MLEQSEQRYQCLWSSPNRSGPWSLSSHRLIHSSNAPAAIVLCYAGIVAAWPPNNVSRGPPPSRPCMNCHVLCTMYYAGVACILLSTLALVTVDAPPRGSDSSRPQHATLTCTPHWSRPITHTLARGSLTSPPKDCLLLRYWASQKWLKLVGSS